MVVLPDQRYPADGASLGYDFFRPDGPGPYPLVIFIHGGGWISGDRTMFRDEAVWLASQGYAAACIEYRLAPLYPFPTPVSDCQAFVTHVKESAGSLAVDAENVTAFGNSAGGHLALMLGMLPNRLDGSGLAADRVNSVVSVCGITDLTDPTDAHFDVAMGFLEQFMDGPYAGREAEWRLASPISHLGSAQGRYLLLHGTADDIVPFAQSRQLAAALHAQGTPVRFVPLEGEGHSFSLEAWALVRRELLAFLAASVPV